MNIDIIYTHPLAKASYGTPGAAAIDCRACTIDGKDFDTYTLTGGSTVLVGTGIRYNIRDAGVAALLLPRSGLGHKSGIVLGNLVGLLDSDYQGELFMSVWNRSNKDFAFVAGDRLAQLCFVPVIRPTFNEVTSFDDITLRGNNGFGSTGI